MARSERATRLLLDLSFYPESLFRPLVENARPLSDSESDARPTVLGPGKNVPRHFEVIAGVQ